MGTWGIGVFENDTACDFAGDVAESGGPASLEKALDHVLAIQDGYLEASDAAEALAAADIIARLNGSRGEQTAYTASIDQWVDRQQSPPPQQLIDKARRCVSRILTEPSEMVELWQEAGEFDAWKRSVEAVFARL
jgi:hypothetical protein